MASLTVRFGSELDIDQRRLLANFCRLAATTKALTCGCGASKNIAENHLLNNRGKARRLKTSCAHGNAVFVILRTYCTTAVILIFHQIFFG